VPSTKLKKEEETRVQQASSGRKGGKKLYENPYPLEKFKGGGGGINKKKKTLQEK